MECAVSEMQEELRNRYGPKVCEIDFQFTMDIVFI